MSPAASGSGLSLEERMLGGQSPGGPVLARRLALCPVTRDPHRQPGSISVPVTRQLPDLVPSVLLMGTFAWPVEVPGAELCGLRVTQPHSRDASSRGPAPRRSRSAERVSENLPQLSRAAWTPH